MGRCPLQRGRRRAHQLHARRPTRRPRAPGRGRRLVQGGALFNAGSATDRQLHDQRQRGHRPGGVRGPGRRYLHPGGADGPRTPTPREPAGHGPTCCSTPSWPANRPDTCGHPLTDRGHNLVYAADRGGGCGLSAARGDRVRRPPAGPARRERRPHAHRGPGAGERRAGGPAIPPAAGTPRGKPLPRRPATVCRGTARRRRPLRHRRLRAPGCDAVARCRQDSRTSSVAHVHQPFPGSNGTSRAHARMLPGVPRRRAAPFPRRVPLSRCGLPTEHGGRRGGVPGSIPRLRPTRVPPHGQRCPTIRAIGAAGAALRWREGGPAGLAPPERETCTPAHGPSPTPC